jgi:methylmalonyl-CoA epimerase
MILNQNTDWTLDHIGIAVENLDIASTEYLKLGYRQTHRETLQSQQVEVSFLAIGTEISAELELIAPTTNTGPLTKFLAKRGPGLHHICYRVPNIEAELAKLASKGIMSIDKVPRPGARGHVIAFLDPKSTGGILVELCQHGTV